jgi:threonine dehydrogenase-like Zn-dependent dehydrogenase
MSPPLDKVLAVIGCGPSIGVTTAALFTAHGFNKITLITHNTQRLEDYRATVLSTAKLAQREPEVKCWDVDVTQSAALNAV